MGIPYYFYNLTKKYKNILIKSPPTDIHIYAIDFNGIIHPEAYKETNKDKLFNNLWSKIEDNDKQDITHLGHWSGTGVVQFKANFEFEK